MRILSHIALACTWTVLTVAGTEAQADSTTLDSPSAARVVGTPADIISDFVDREARGLRTHQLATSSSAWTITGQTRDYHHDAGYLALRGHASGEGRSDFMIKGDDQNLYGWLVLHDQDLVWEYTTNAAGQVEVREVALEKIFPICRVQDPHWLQAPFSEEAPADERGVSGPEPHIGSYDGRDLMKLQSLPGAQKVMYMDITRVMNGSTPKHIAKAEMFKNWQSVASALSMFEVNVTTDPAVYTAAGVSNSGIARFVDEDGRSNAPLNSFGSTSYSTNYRNRNGYGYGRTSAHEIGHQLGLHHDRGTPGGEYFEGFPEFKWTPIMGNYWPGDRWGDEALYQYSKSEYDSGTNKQDDLAVVNRYLPFRDDDYPNPVALEVDASGAVALDANYGQINSSRDVDEFTFEIGSGGGRAELRIDRIEYIGGAFLDVDAELVDADGDSLARSNPKAARHAEIAVNLNAGSYTLRIRGGAEGTPQNGFPAYSSLGFYGIVGQIDGVGDDDSDTGTGDDTSSSSESTGDGDDSSSSETDSSTGGDDGTDSGTTTGDSDTGSSDEGEVDASSDSGTTTGDEDTTGDDESETGTTGDEGESSVSSTDSASDSGEDTTSTGDEGEDESESSTDEGADASDESGESDEDGASDSNEESDGADESDESGDASSSDMGDDGGDEDSEGEDTGDEGIDLPLDDVEITVSCSATGRDAGLGWFALVLAGIAGVRRRR